MPDSRPHKGINLQVVCSECCEQVVVSADDFTLYVYETDKTDHSHYTFTCPQCNETTTREVSQYFVALMVHNGIVPQVPAWLLEEKPDLGPMDLDEVIELMTALDAHNHAAATDGNVLIGDED